MDFVDFKGHVGEDNKFFFSFSEDENSDKAAFLI